MPLLWLAAGCIIKAFPSILNLKFEIVPHTFVVELLNGLNDIYFVGGKKSFRNGSTYDSSMKTQTLSHQQWNENVSAATTGHSRILGCQKKKSLYSTFTQRTSEVNMWAKDDISIQVTDRRDMWMIASSIRETQSNDVRRWQRLDVGRFWRCKIIEKKLFTTFPLESSSKKVL